MKMKKTYVLAGYQETMTETLKGRYGNCDALKFFIER